MKRLLTSIVALSVLGLLFACSDAGYYVQSITGHFDVMAKARPIDALVGDPQTAADERQKLIKVLDLRNFAVTELGLPDNGTYRQYADIGRPYVLWNVVAVPEFSLTPKQWCFPVAGCVSYRGYFDQAEAEGLGSRLESEGYDVNVYGVPAYSTLNWFDDPVLNTFFTASDTRLAGLLFHELAHQVVYLAGDSSFNEAFAQTVETEGVKRWLQSRGTGEELQSYVDDEAQRAVFQKYLREIRAGLAALYRRPMAEQEMREAKLDLFEKAKDRYIQLKQSGELDDSYDAWMKRGINNARLASIATYRDLVPGFQAMLEQNQGDFSRFYDEVARLSRRPEPQRYFQLKGRFQFEQHARKRPADE